MREIKFRVWDKHEKKMGKVTGIKFSDVQHTLVHYRYVDDRGRVIDEQSHVDDKGHGVVVLVQYTGLKDKNGKEIYEGDIVKAASQGSNTVCTVKWGQGRVGFFIHAPGICWNLSGSGKDYDQETVEIIGNIYENPELLGDQHVSK